MALYNLQHHELVTFFAYLHMACCNRQIPGALQPGACACAIVASNQGTLAL